MVLLLFLLLPTPIAHLRKTIEQHLPLLESPGMSSLPPPRHVRPNLPPANTRYHRRRRRQGWNRRARPLTQIATTATSRPEALTSRSMSSGSLVRIVAFCLRAVVTTTASTTSAVLVLPNSRPASCASVSPRGTTTHPVKKRLSWACCGDRLTWATTGAGTNGIMPTSKRALCSAHARRSFLSAATRMAAS